MTVEPDEYDFWQDELGLTGPYSSDIDEHMLAVLRDLHENRPTHYDKIAERLGLYPPYVELLLTLLASAGWLEYGTSPRSGWLDDSRHDPNELVKRFRQYFTNHWGQNPDA